MALLISAAAQDALLKTVTLVVDLSVLGDATPADKVQGTDLNGVAVVRSEGIVAAADAIEDLSADFATAADATGIIGLLLDMSQVGVVEKVMEVRTFADSGTLVATSPSAGSAVSNFLSDEGNIAIDLDSSVALNAANTASGRVIVVFKLK